MGEVIGMSLTAESINSPFAAEGIGSRRAAGRRHHPQAALTGQKRKITSFKRSPVGRHQHASVVRGCAVRGSAITAPHFHKSRLMTPKLSGSRQPAVISAFASCPHPLIWDVFTPSRYSLRKSPRISFAGPSGLIRIRQAPTAPLPRGQFRSLFLHHMTKLRRLEQSYYTMT